MEDPIGFKTELESALSGVSSDEKVSDYDLQLKLRKLAEDEGSNEDCLKNFSLQCSCSERD